MMLTFLTQFHKRSEPQKFDNYENHENYNDDSSLRVNCPR